MNISEIQEINVVLALSTPKHEFIVCPICGDIHRLKENLYCNQNGTIIDFDVKPIIVKTPYTIILDYYHNNITIQEVIDLYDSKLQTKSHDLINFDLMEVKSINY
jgi:hypothetical protein